MTVTVMPRNDSLKGSQGPPPKGPRPQWNGIMGGFLVCLLIIECILIHTKVKVFGKGEGQMKRHKKGREIRP